MADNVTFQSTTLATLPAGTVVAVKAVTHGGDAASLQVISLVGVTGSEGSYTIQDIAYGGGVEAAALRVTVASDSTGVLSIDDNGASITVDGTVAATQSGTWTEANSAAIAASASVLDDWDETDRAKVNMIVGQAGIAAGAGAVGVTVPRVTLASDDPAVVALQILDNFISGARGLVTEDNSAAIAASLSVMDDWDETDRIKANIIVGQAGVAAGTGLDGATVIRVTLATNVPLPAGTNNIGDVDVLSSALPTGASTLAEQQTQTTAMQLLTGALVIDDQAFTPATTKVMMAGFEFDDAAPDSVNEGDAGAARMSANRNIYTTIRDAAGNERGVNVSAGNALIVDGSAVTQPVSIAGTVTVASHAVTNAGTFVVQENGAALTALQLIDNLVLAEDAAHVTADPGVQMLAVRKATPATLSNTDGDYEPLQISVGRLWVSATIDAALPAGSSNIGDVDVLSLIPGTAATNLGKAEDAVAASGDTGVMALAVRNDVPAALAGTTLDYIPLTTDALGRLWTANASEYLGTVTATVATSGTTSGEVDCRGYTQGGILIPSTFDGTQITFTVCEITGGTFVALYDLTNVLLTVTSAASRAIPIPAEVFAFGFFKIVTVTTQATTDTIFKVTLKG